MIETIVINEEKYFKHNYEFSTSFYDAKGNPAFGSPCQEIVSFKEVDGEVLLTAKKLNESFYGVYRRDGTMLFGGLHNQIGEFHEFCNHIR